MNNLGYSVFLGWLPSHHECGISRFFETIFLTRRMEERMVVIPPPTLQRRSCIFYELVETSDIYKGKKTKKD